MARWIAATPRRRTGSCELLSSCVTVKEVATPKTVGRVRSLADRAAQLFPVRVVRRFADHGGPNQAVVIAWNSLTAIFPIALALAAHGGFVLDRAGITGGSFAERMGSFFPEDLGTQQALIQGLD